METKESLCILRHVRRKPCPDCVRTGRGLLGTAVVREGFSEGVAFGSGPEACEDVRGAEDT